MSSLPYSGDFIVYRSFSREADALGRATDKDFLLRPNETALSIALSPEKAMDELDSRGYVELRASTIRGMGLEVRVKTGAENPGSDPEIYEIAGIPLDSTDARISISIALAATAGITVLVPGRRSRRRTRPRATDVPPGDRA